MQIIPFSAHETRVRKTFGPVQERFTADARAYGSAAFSQLVVEKNMRAALGRDAIALVIRGC